MSGGLKSGRLLLNTFILPYMIENVKISITSWNMWSASDFCLDSFVILAIIQRLVLWSKTQVLYSAGSALAAERLTVEREVVGSFPGARLDHSLLG